MKYKMRSSTYLLIASVILALYVTAGCADIEHNSNNGIESARSRFVLPKLFDFSRFKQLFKKSYNSFVEELARQKLFLARVFNAMITMVKYKHEKSDHYQSVNQMSDRTPEELRKRMLSPEKLHRGRKNSHGDTRSHHSTTRDELPVADVEDIKKVIEEVKTHKDEPGYREIAEELEQVSGQSRRKREAHSGKRRQITLDDLLPQEDATKQDLREYRRKIESNNEEYEPPELMSFGYEDTEKTDQMEPSLISKIGSMTGITSLFSMVRQTSDEMSNKPEVKLTLVNDMPDIVYVDHRQSKCFFDVRDQGNCGSCWAFSTIAMFEYMHCRQTGKLEAFSEQFLIDCGYHVSSDLEACEGGSDDVATDFVFEAGLQLRSNYPYLERNGTCPYQHRRDLRRAGFVVLKDRKEYREVSIENIEKVLERTPVLMGMLVTDDFSFYGGGIDSMDECENEEMSHAMLLVGHGRQDGKEYFLFRNSHSKAWGERGYYKLSKDSFYKCAADPFGGVVRGRF